MNDLLEILDLARWAPSGDNSQPWRFRVAGENCVDVIVPLERPSIFDHGHFATALSAGALLATLRQAASSHGYEVTITEGGKTSSQLTYLATFVKNSAARNPALAEIIKKRSVCRTSYLTRPLRDDEKQALQTEAGEGFRVFWIEGPHKRSAVKVLCSAEKIRTFTPEVFQEYQRVIDWKNSCSAEKMPGAAMGLSRATQIFASLMFRSWSFHKLFNRVLGGYLVSLVTLDILPGFGCAAHFVLLADHPPETLRDHVKAGEAVQRVWLKATELGLVHQPAISPLAFARYAAEGRSFSAHPKALGWAREVKAAMKKMLEDREDLSSVVWFGRIGEGQNQVSRSLRRPLSDLIESSDR